MTIKYIEDHGEDYLNHKAQSDGLLHLDLTGPEGNAFVLVGYARYLYTKLVADPINDPTMLSPANKIVQQMVSGDYEHTVATFEKYFSKHAVLYRYKPNQDLVA